MDEIITAIHQINDFRPTESALEPLKSVKFLPIKDPEHNQRNPHYRSTTEDFFIIDRDGWPLLFYGKVPTLHLTLNQVRDLRPFLSCLGLSDRFISTAAVKKTFVSTKPTESSMDLTHEFRQRAAALSRSVHLPLLRCNQ